MPLLDKKVRKRKSENPRSPGSYDYLGLAHWWVYNNGHASTAFDRRGGVYRMSAEGTRIKSYSTVIGRMFDPVKKGGQPLILLTSNNYSPTTQTHMGAILSAASHMDYLYIANPDPCYMDDHQSNLNVLLSNLDHLAEEYPKKRRDSTRKAVANAMAENVSVANRYASYFKLKKTSPYKQIVKFPMPDDVDFESKIEQSVKDRMMAEQRARSKKVRDLEKQKKKEYEKAQSQLALWLKGEEVYVNRGYLDKVYLRIVDNTIETTENASIGMGDAIRAYIRFSKGKLNKGMHIGAYTYGGIDEDKNAHIGCHTIPLADIDKMVATVIAERAAYAEDDKRDRDKAYAEEMDVGLDELFGELKDLMSGIDNAVSEISGAMGVPSHLIGQDEVS